MLSCHHRGTRLGAAAAPAHRSLSAPAAETSPRRMSSQALLHRLRSSSPPSGARPSLALACAAGLVALPPAAAPSPQPRSGRFSPGAAPWGVSAAPPLSSGASV
eukprot:5795694-Pyramimonas_sp.AAC.1